MSYPKHPQSVVDRARLLHSRGYSAREIEQHLYDEGIDVTRDCIRQWIHYRTRNGKPLNPPPRPKFTTIRELAKLAGMSRAGFHKRLKTGWSLEEALTTPARGAE